jgi:hypothetical protein
MGISQSSARKFVTDSAGQKVGDLPERVEKKADGGSVGVYPKPFNW